ncbi:MAG TPA: aldehyde dehydrogenase family protein [Gaiellaceae bacterium]|jgi:succinate-semialdehyde dehydrogenase/glutarate-semialdehyde dehydrogenase|nr:aldehyde dehydrogenase family protein [Gaiellaceae bacterium]
MAVAAGGELRVVNPATLELVGSVPTLGPEAVQELVAEARLAQEQFGQAPLAERRALLANVAELLLERADEIADVIVAETAKPRAEAFTTELFPALDALTWLARNMPKLLEPERIRYPQLHLKHKRAELRYEPLGVVGVIAPWNFPFAIPFTQVAYAVAAGNAVVLKPSELTPLSGALVEQLFVDAGASPSLVRVAQGDGEVGAALVRSRGLGKVLFTGSSEVGRLVAAAAGERLLPVTLELGGKDPMVVLDDADLARAVDGALWASFFNCGQVCSGVERIYVEGALYEPFVEELAARARELELGPLISEAQRDRVDGLVGDALALGARALAGGRVPERTGWYYEPTVLVDVPAGARIEHDETFGPVVTVARVQDEATAVRAANGGVFGLGASVWTRSEERASRVARKLRAGSVWHNDHAYTYASAQAAWGGRGESGFGRTHSKHGLYDLTSPKFVDRDSGRVPVPWWFPYDENMAAAFRGAARVLYGSHKLESAWRERRALVAMAKRYRL